MKQYKSETIIMSQTLMYFLCVTVVFSTAHSMRPNGLTWCWMICGFHLHLGAKMNLPSSHDDAIWTLALYSLVWLHFLNPELCNQMSLLCCTALPRWSVTCSKVFVFILNALNAQNDSQISQKVFTSSGASLTDGMKWKLTSNTTRCSTAVVIFVKCPSA